MAASWRNPFASWLRLAVFVLVLLVSTHAAFADGKVFRQAVADFSHVPMPDQRALIVWDEHRSAGATQTLVIESGFTAQPGSSGYAWVLPLPAPAAVSAATPGLFPTLQALAAPRVQVVSSGATTWVLVWLIIGIAIWAYAPLSKSKVAAVVAAMLLIASVLLVPALGTARSSLTGQPSAQVQVIDRTLVGAQEVTQVTGGSAALRAWLTEQGVVVDDAVGKAVDAYAADGWIFAAVRLTAEQSAERLDLSTPPIVFLFPTRQPVYPMRLTGANSGTPLDLELYVLGHGAADVDGLTTVSSAPIMYRQPRDRIWVPAPSQEIEISHPGLRSLAGPSTHFTQLRGRLAHDQMQADLPIQFSGTGLKGREAWTVGAAAQRGLHVALIVLLILIIRAHLWEQRKPTERRAGRRRALAWAAVGSMVAGSAAFAVLPKVDANTSGGAVLRAVRFLPGRLELQFADRPATLREVREAAAACVSEAGGDDEIELAEGDAPRQYRFEVDSDGAAWFVWIDPMGRACRLPMAIQIVPELGPEAPPPTPSGD